MNNMTDMLNAILNELRGKMESEDIISLLVSTTFLVKLEPSTLDKLAECDERNLYQELNEISLLMRQQFSHLKKELFYLPIERKVDKKGLIAIIGLVTKISKDNLYSDFTSAIRELKQSRAKARDIGDGTNKNISFLLRILIGNCENKTLFDGACGLAQIASELAPKSGYLNEVNLASAVMAERLLILNELDQFSIQSKDSLIGAEQESTSVDIVVMEPPLALNFSADQRRLLAKVDYLLVNPGELLPASAGDVMWLQLALSRLNETGKAYLLLPQGWLFRGGFDAKVRDKLLELDVIETIIALPPQILAFTSIPPAIVVLSKQKEKSKMVNFINATNFGAFSKGLRELSLEDSMLISELAVGKHPEHSHFRAVTTDEIKGNDNLLTVNRYVNIETKIEQVDLADEIKKLNEMRVQYNHSQKQLEDMLKNLGFKLV